MGLKLGEDLENLFSQRDHLLIRSSKFVRELKNCLAPYREVLKEYEKQTLLEDYYREELCEENDLSSLSREFELLLSDIYDQ